MIRKSLTSATIAAFFLIAGWALPAWADGGVTFTDVAADPATGIDWARTVSPDRMAERAADYAKTPIPPSEFGSVELPNYPMKSHGAPGVALLDFDVDGDVDIYVANGPGTANSLYSNQLMETGSLTFVDVGLSAGVDATSQDSAAVCFGDIDNDGDPDLYVAATGDLNRLYENNGDGTFTDITDNTVAGDGRHVSGCSFLDIDADGYLDLVVGNSYSDWTHRRHSNTPGPSLPGLEHNYLFQNQGNNTFRDVSAVAGLEEVSNMDQPGLSGAALTWAIGSFDYDQDGDTDILCADNQGATANDFSERRGWLRLYDNSGRGHFTEVTEHANLRVDGGWMGLTFGDYNCDGNMDFFATNLGDFLTGNAAHSTFYYNDGSGVFTPDGLDSGLEDTNAFGWGTSTLDYDNDGDLDVVYHGGVDRFNFIGCDNPGVLALNEGVCSGEFTYDVEAFTTDHAQRNVHGVATGDINNDGFADIVTASAFTLMDTAHPFYLNIANFGATESPLIPQSFVQFILANSAMAGGLIPVHPTDAFPPGNLTVELNSADNGNRWVKVKTRGSVGTVTGGTVNRDGFGAVISVTPKNGGPTVTRPVVGGSSYASQDAHDLVFGLGRNNKVDIDVLWPGGVRNRLLNVSAGETVVLPEIPCSYTANQTYVQYSYCVQRSLNELVDQGIVTRKERARFLVSAAFAYFQFRGGVL